MTETPKAVFCWSGGKDSSYCLHKVLTEKLFNVKYLLTTVNDKFKRISMHGVREELLDAQAESIGISLIKVRVTEGTNDEYEKQMEVALLKVKSEEINNVIFGDIFLEDLRKYRESNLAKLGMKGIFPLWKMDTTNLINDFISRQFKAVVCCVNDGCLGKEWAGREIDKSFIQQLPTTVDPCGENGEFHTFCYDGPLFKKKINFIVGKKVYKPFETKTADVCTLPSNVTTKGFWFCDLIPPEEHDFLNGDMDIPDYIKSKLLKIGNISVKERLIIGLRFGLDDNKPQTLQAIAYRFGISKQRVEQILNKILIADYEEIEKENKNLTKSERNMTQDEPLSNFLFSKRTLNALAQAGIKTKKQLINIKVLELFQTWGLGRKSIEELLIFFSNHSSWFDNS